MSCPRHVAATLMRSINDGGIYSTLHFGDAAAYSGSDRWQIDNRQVVQARKTLVFLLVRRLV